MRSIVPSTLVIALYGVSLFPSVVSYAPSKWGMQTRRSPLQMASDGKEGSSFSLTNLFGGGSSSESTASAPTLRGNKNLEPHPAKRPHISPLNRLGPDKVHQPKEDPLPVHPEVRSGTLTNGLPYIILPNKNPPNRFEAHLQVFSGSGTLTNWLCFRCCPFLQ